MADINIVIAKLLEVQARSAEALAEARAIAGSTPTPAAPSITNASVTPNRLPSTGGSVIIDATIKDATSVLLDGAVVAALPLNVPVSASHTFRLVAKGAALPDAAVDLAVVVDAATPVPTPGHHKVVISSPAPGAKVSGAMSLVFSLGGYSGGGSAMLLVDGLPHWATNITNGIPDDPLIFDPLLLSYGPHTLHLRCTLANPFVPDISAGVTVLVGTPVSKPAPGPRPAANSPYLYFYSPATGTQAQSYIRHQMGANGKGPFILSRAAPASIILRCQKMGGMRATIPTSRFILDGIPVSDWIIPTNNEIQLNLDLSTTALGSHCLWAESQGSLLWCEGVLIEVVDNPSTPLAGARDVWACATVEDLTYGVSSPSVLPFKVRYEKQPDLAGNPIPMPGRTRTPWSNELAPIRTAGKIAPSDLWAQPIVPTTKNGWPRRFYQTPQGHVHTCSYQQYQYWHLEWNAMPLYDGPRGVGAFGHAWAGRVDPATGAFHGVSTQGRFWYCHIDGRISTIAGFRRPLNATPISPDQVENVGIWIDGPARFQEPWGLEWEVADGPGFRKTWYIADTYNHCLRLVDMTPLLSPGGISTIRTFAGSRSAEKGYRDGPADQALFDSLWDVAQNPASRMLYLTDFENAAIRTLDPTTMQVATLYKSPIGNPKYLGKPANNVIPPVPQSVDGPFGTATLYYPQSIKVDSKGNLVVACKWDRGGGTLRYIDLAAKTITTIWAPVGDANTRDWTIALSDGTTGPLDSIFVTRWGSTGIFNKTATGYSWGGQIGIDESDGTWRPGAVEGQANQAFHINYPTLVACAGGCIVLVGTGSEGAYRYTLKLPTDPMQNNAKFSLGRGIYIGNWGFRHGIDGQDTLEGNGFAQLRQLSNVDLATLMRSGWGLPNSVNLSDAEMDALIYYIRWPEV